MPQPLCLLLVPLVQHNLHQCHNQILQHFNPQHPPTIPCRAPPAIWTLQTRQPMYQCNNSSSNILLFWEMRILPPRAQSRRLSKKWWCLANWMALVGWWVSVHWEMTWRISMVFFRQTIQASTDPTAWQIVIQVRVLVTWAVEWVKLGS